MNDCRSICGFVGKFILTLGSKKMYHRSLALSNLPFTSPHSVPRNIPVSCPQDEKTQLIADFILAPHRLPASANGLTTELASWAKLPCGAAD